MVPVRSSVVRNLTFFDTAAALIPVLLLGGAITERFRRESRRETEGLSSNEGLLVVLLFFLLPAFAEMTAISAALGDIPNDFQVWVVTFAVAFGTCALAASLTWPWLKAIMLGGRVRTGISAVMFLVLVVGFTRLLVTSVDLETVRQDVAGITEDADRPLGSVAVLRYLNAQERALNARVAAGLISRAEAARERLELARTRSELAMQNALDEVRRNQLPDPIGP